jgi:RimJ/RimL family protein N-acetyltransferase
LTTFLETIGSALLNGKAKAKENQRQNYMCVHLNAWKIYQRRYQSKNIKRSMGMATRTRDFGGDFVITPVSLVHKNLLVKTSTLQESMEFSDIRERNSDSIYPFKVLDKSKKPKIPFGIYFKDVPVGEVTLWNISDGHCYVSYWVDESYRKKGIASMAVALVTDYAFSKLSIEEIEAPILEENQASKDLIRKLFFSIAGYETFTSQDGIQRPHEMYLQLKPTDQEELSLIEYVEDKYSFDE